MWCCTTYGTIYPIGICKRSVINYFIYYLQNISDNFKSVLFDDYTTLLFSNTSSLELKNNIQCNINKL